MKTLHKATALHGEVSIPGDKSISHRAVMFGSLAKGDSIVTNFLDGADCNATIDCFDRLGIFIERDWQNPGRLIVHGTGLHGLYPSYSPVALYTQNSGTTTRIMSGILAPQHFSAFLSGDDSVNSRPMKRAMAPLRLMGADITSLNGDDCAPLRINGSALHGMVYRTPVASAQVKSAILCAGLYADGTTTVIEPAKSRDHTERMLRAFGAHVAEGEEALRLANERIASAQNLTPEVVADYGIADHLDANNQLSLQPGEHIVTISPATELTAHDVVVPGDISSAAYFIAAALIVPGSEVLIRNVGTNPTRDGILRVAKAMGGDITVLNEVEAAEPYADLLVKSSPLHGIDISGDIIPTLIDELPVIAVMAACAKGTTVIRDAAELKVKESDRIATVTEGLTAMGARVTPADDGMIIEGGNPLHGANIRTFRDHRLAMSFAVASLVADGDTTLDDEDCVNVSYPNYFEDMQRLSE